ncbi:hypothetical protein BN134_863 [Cronobacter dublinensis 1210]|uniref:Uncharacterized protein n=1 Tax=Cronobacter dublinensis 1210 TaxID=1208656 RepID=A0ABM9Q487_9ENTR|nr:hypothetical protein BN134_863 [Cronobacter dublinensis 1210]
MFFDVKFTQNAHPRAYTPADRRCHSAHRHPFQPQLHLLPVDVKHAIFSARLYYLMLVVGIGVLINKSRP